MADKEVTTGMGGVRMRFRDLDFLSSDEANKAYAQYFSAAPVTPLGHQEYSVGASAVPLASIPAGAKRMHVRVLTADIFWTDFPGDTPTLSHGFPIKADEWLLYDSEPTPDFKMVSSAVADVRIAFYG